MLGPETQGMFWRDWFPIYHVNRGTSHFHGPFMEQLPLLSSSIKSRSFLPCLLSTCCASHHCFNTEDFSHPCVLPNIIPSAWHGLFQLTPSIWSRKGCFRLTESLDLKSPFFRCPFLQLLLLPPFFLCRISIKFSSHYSIFVCSSSFQLRLWLATFIEMYWIFLLISFFTKNIPSSKVQTTILSICSVV